MLDKEQGRSHSHTSRWTILTRHLSHPTIRKAEPQRWVPSGKHYTWLWNNKILYWENSLISSFSIAMWNYQRVNDQPSVVGARDQPKKIGGGISNQPRASHPGPQKRQKPDLFSAFGVAPSGMFMWMYASVVPVFTQASWGFTNVCACVYIHIYIYIYNFCI